jgi:hypothetical protein
MLDPFSNDAFGQIQLTEAINLVPNRYGRVGQLGLMPSKGVRTRKVALEERNGVLTLLPTAELGSPGTVGKRGKRKVRSFVIPHIPHDDAVLPEEVQNLRAFGAENQLASLADIMAEHLQTMRDKHAITLEHLRMGGLKGVILDADGSVLYDLFSEFGISAKIINFALDNSDTDVLTKCLELKRYIEDSLMGQNMSHVHVLVSSEFFDALTNHPEVRDAYDRWQDGAAKRDDLRKGFIYGEILFEEYRGRADTPDGTVRRFIAEGEGHAFPVGTNVFSTYFAPADFNEAVNQPGLELYAKQEPRKFDRGTDLHTQSNPLPMCSIPTLLVKLTAS